MNYRQSFISNIHSVRLYLYYLVHEAGKQFNELVENSHIEEQLENLITVLQLRLGG